MQKLASIIAILLVSLSATAAESGPTDTIVVTATRTEILLRDATVPITVITRQDIEQALATDLAELLRFEAGIDIGRNGGPGQTTSVFLRGSESNHTSVLVDGVRVNPGTIGGAAIQNISPEIIQRIEIVKGARSALFGTDAIGGVINIITRRSQQSYIEGSLGAGSFDTRSGFFGAGGRSDYGDFGVTLDWNDTLGYPIRTDSDIERGYENASVNLHAGKQFGNSRVTLRHWSTSGTAEYLDFFLSPLDQDYDNRSTALEVQTEFTEALQSRILISQITDEIEQNQTNDFIETDRLAMDWQMSLATNNHTVTGGLFISDEDAASFAFGDGFDETTAVKAVFLQDQWSHDKHRSFLAVRLTDHETFGNEVTWNAEYAFSINERWSLSGGFGHAFRAPDATDRYGFGGRADLRPEIADEIQLGLRYNAGGRHSVGLELYQNDINDLIEFDLETFELRNINSAEIRGAELNWAYQGEQTSVRASLVKQHADNATDGVRLLRRAEESLTLSITRNIGEHRLGLSLLASGDREDFAGTKLAGYLLTNLTGQFSITRNWRLNARIENVFDREYETAAGFRMQERSGFLELRYAWK